MKKLNTLDATMLVMGSMIGSGIFLVSAEVGRQLTSPIAWIMTWVLTSFVTITGAYAYGKLSTVFPKTGGQYIYLKESYNPMIGFLFGWTTFLVIQTGTIAAVAVAFAKYTGILLPELINDIPLVGNYITSQQILAAILIATLTFVNLRGISFASLLFERGSLRTPSIFTSLLRGLKAPTGWPTNCSKTPRVTTKLAWAVIN